MRKVRDYSNAEEFQKGIDEQSRLGWVLESWHMAPYPYTHYVGILIIAVFRGRR